MDGEVEPHQLSELSVTVSQHVGEVVGPVQVGVDGSDAAAFTIKVAVDLSGDAGQLGNQVHGVFIDKLRYKKMKVCKIVSISDKKNFFKDQLQD